MKHPHKLILQNKRTWRCAIGGCNFFVHLGLAHVLIGKIGVCWGCEDNFIIDTSALREEMPRCIDCRMSNPLPIIEQTPELQEVEKPEVDEAKRKLYKSLGWKLE